MSEPSTTAEYTRRYERLCELRAEHSVSFTTQAEETRVALALYVEYAKLCRPT